ncbi:thiamine-phosphate kinase [Crocinitomix catalasitica]|uniref:thiamine-phosphate kinase n=1 Tax=Crocinitomix catalasitica TaxID=184607 RepID=UPI0004845A91|nr:thiamine-phosphate kinase [Crocinitomix catalasitica]
MDENRTELEDLGEFGLIEKLTKNTEKYHASTIAGVGDDAAIISDGDNYKVVSTDMLVEGVHFDLSYAPLMHLGYKAVVVNLSDIYAMNADATQITVSIAVSNRFSVEALEELYKGIHKACELYQVDLVGGDTTSSPAGLIISVTAIGEVTKEDVVMRSGAKENELLVVSGNLGAAYMGLQVLEREKQVFIDNPDIQPDLVGVDYILERQLKPEARKDIIHYLKELGVRPTSMIDISDGLASEAIHLCQASDLGCTIYDEKIPIDTETHSIARDFELDPSMCALNGGEDYELLFSIKQEDFDRIKGNEHLAVIGHFTDKGSGMNIVDRGGQLVPLVAQGWNHF